MVNIDDINPQEFVKELAESLKEVPEIKAPVWAKFVKTGHYKERPPVNNEWWHIRAAAILRTIYKLGPVGTSKLRTKYGGKKNRGVAAEHSYKGSGSIIRKVLQQLEKAGLVTQATKGIHKGRILSKKGHSYLNSIAKKINPEKPAKKQELPEAPKEEKEKKPRKRKEKDAGQS